MCRRSENHIRLCQDRRYDVSRDRGLHRYRSGRPARDPGLEPDRTESAAAQRVHPYPHRCRRAGVVQANRSQLRDAHERCAAGFCRKPKANEHNAERSSAVSQGLRQPTNQPIRYMRERDPSFDLHSTRQVERNYPSPMGRKDMSKALLPRKFALMVPSSK